MGRNFATDLAQSQEMSLENQISIHFSSNCYPPVPQFMVDVAVQAITACNSEEPEQLIDLPAGVEFRNEKQVKAYELVDSLRLEAWVY